MTRVQAVEEQLHLAVVGLASGTGRIQNRLADAFEGALAALSPGDFPTVLADEFAFIRNEILLRAPIGQEANPDEQTDAEARAVARQIVSLYARYASFAASESAQLV
jgi:hypothetical protein